MLKLENCKAGVNIFSSPRVSVAVLQCSRIGVVNMIIFSGSCRQFYFRNGISLFAFCFKTLFGKDIVGVLKYCRIP